MTSHPAAREARPISHWSTNASVFALVAPHLQRGARVADVGAGEGFFSQKMGDYLRTLGKSPAAHLAACDLFPDQFRYDGIPCDAVRDGGLLPYGDATFDVVCSLEVIEHLEDQFLFVREIARILKPGGVAIISTPNVLNINSRLRFLRSGFAVLFDPLSLSTSDPVHTSGHVHPVSYYYLAYMLRSAGFAPVVPRYDRYKTSAKLLLALSALYVYPGRFFFRRRFRTRNPRVDRENAPLLQHVNSVAMLTARSVIAVGTKRPADGNAP